MGQIEYGFVYNNFEPIMPALRFLQVALLGTFDTASLHLVKNYVNSLSLQVQIISTRIYQNEFEIFLDIPVTIPYNKVRFN